MTYDCGAHYEVDRSTFGSFSYYKTASVVVAASLAGDASCLGDGDTVDGVEVAVVADDSVAVTP